MSTAIDSPQKPPAKAADEAKGVVFMKLREGMCKFPLGRFNEPAEWFCGMATVVGTPYCTDCQKIAYTRAERRR